MSLTKKSLLANAIADKPHLLGEFFGDKVYVKRMTELQRSRRAAKMFDKNGDIAPKYIEQARVLSIIDHVCDEKGELVFGPSDVADLMGIQADKLDELLNAITEWVAGDEGNE